MFYLKNKFRIKREDGNREDIPWRISTQGKEYSSNPMYSASVRQFLYKDMELFH